MGQKNDFQEKTCCDGRKDVVNCEQIHINIPLLLNQQSSIMLKDIKLTWTKTSSTNTQVYETEDGSEAIISYDIQTGNIFGLINTDDRSFSIHRCKDIHILEEFDLPKIIEMEHENDVVFDDNVQERTIAPYPDAGPTKLPDFSLTPSKPFSVKFYYTPEFAEYVDFENDDAKILQFFRVLVDLTNEGFHNSKLPIVMTLNCYERATISDADAGDITAFEKMKGTEKALRQSADVAILLTKELFWKKRNKFICGFAKGGVAVVQLNCAKSQYSVGHEIGHIFGAPGDHLNGHISLKKNSNDTFFRTIMAYNDSNLPTERANMYSSPISFELIGLLPSGKTFSPNRTIPVDDINGFNGKPSTGDIIIQNLERIAAKGDESEACVMGAKERKSEIRWNSLTDLVMGPTVFTSIHRTWPERRKHFCQNFPKHCEPGHSFLHGRHGEIYNYLPPIRKEGPKPIGRHERPWTDLGHI